MAEVVQLLEDYRSHRVFRTEHQRGTGYGLNPYWPAVSKEKHEKMMGEWLLVPRGLVSDASSPEATTTALLNLADELLLSHLSYPHAAVFSSLSRLQFEPSSLSCSKVASSTVLSRSLISDFFSSRTVNELGFFNGDRSRIVGSFGAG